MIWTNYKVVVFLAVTCSHLFQNIQFKQIKYLQGGEPESHGPKIHTWTRTPECSELTGDATDRLAQLQNPEFLICADVLLSAARMRGELRQIVHKVLRIWNHICHLYVIVTQSTVIHFTVVIVDDVIITECKFKALVWETAGQSAIYHRQPSMLWPAGSRVHRCTSPSPSPSLEPQHGKNPRDASTDRKQRCR